MFDRNKPSTTPILGDRHSITSSCFSYAALSPAKIRRCEVHAPLRTGRPTPTPNTPQPQIYLLSDATWRGRKIDGPLVPPPKREDTLSHLYLISVPPGIQLRPAVHACGGCGSGLGAWVGPRSFSKLVMGDSNLPSFQHEMARLVSRRGAFLATRGPAPTRQSCARGIRGPSLPEAGSWIEPASDLFAPLHLSPRILGKRPHGWLPGWVSRSPGA